MTPWFSALLLPGLVLLSIQRFSVSADEECLEKFKRGKNDFFVDVTESVNEGATLLASPSVHQAEECVWACCAMSLCNLAMLERSSDGGSIKACYLFDCMYGNQHVCSFVKNKGFDSYILNTVYERYLGHHIKNPSKKDRPPVANAGADQWVQPTNPVFLNGFQSRDDHKVVKYEWRLLEGDRSVIMEKTQLEDQVSLSNLSVGEYLFQLTVTDSNGQSDSDEMTVRVLSPKETWRYCHVPKKVGPCRGYFQRWHYNTSTQRCGSFVYGGCKANLNNYISEWECNNTCMGVSESSLASRGLPDPDSKGVVCGTQCKAMQFSCGDGCCLDADMECDGVPQCNSSKDEASCQLLNTTLSHLLSILVDQKEARCTEPPETGPCRAHLSQYYYDPLRQKCRHFIYGGCRGNQNKFELESTCMDTCKSVTEHDVFIREVFERSEDDRSHSAAVVLGLLLGIAAVGLLAVLGYRFRKRRKEQGQGQHQRVPVNPAMAPAPVAEDAEHLVYNSTTKPL